MALPMHPEAVPQDPATLRWVVPADSVPFTGPVAGAPGRLGHLLADGTLAGLVCDRAGVLVTLTDGRSWREVGDVVRGALQEALAEPATWVPACEQDSHRIDTTDLPSCPPRRGVDTNGTDVTDVKNDTDGTTNADGTTSASDDEADDATLAAAAREALAGAVGDYVRSHGGKVDLVDVREGVALVRLSGACSGCSASALTIHGRLERHLLDEIPGLTAVRQAPALLTLLRTLGLGRGR